MTSHSTVHASKLWSQKSSLEKYNAMGSWFLGPRGENAELMKEKANFIIDGVKKGRMNYYPDDPEFITRTMADSQDFKDSTALLQKGLEFLSDGLANHSTPFYSPRYAAHMNADVSMPASLGYLLAQQYNQNNVAPDGSPFTSYIEWEVGQQLCRMIGYNTPNQIEDEWGQILVDGSINFPPLGVDNNEIAGWGHIAAGGSIANLESMWIARNLKYYALSLHQAMGPNQSLSFISPTFGIKLCTGQFKNFYSCRPWELMNLTPTEVADIPGRLYNEYGISPEVLGTKLAKFSIQSVGKAHLDAIYHIDKPSQYMISVANHYSWAKAAALTGIGRDNLVTVGVDYAARMDANLLEQKLLERLEEERGVYCVVVIAGTTEHGSVDPLREVIAIRERMHQKGMSFMIHVDAAWGGYFATKAIAPNSRTSRERYAFSIPLNPWAFDHLSQLKHADTVTVDPHKSGFVPYSAGALCMRDGRHRFLTTWSSAYINVNLGSDIAMGIYGIEGSKPGAAPVAAYLSHRVIGLMDGGYEDLLGTAMFTGVKMYCHWATMSLKSSTLTVTPFNLLPIELQKPNATSDEILAAQREILTKIVNRKNDELENDDDAMALLSQLGSDTMIYAFSCNFKHQGVLNEDVIEANFLNNRLYQRLSLQTPKDDLHDRPIFVGRTEFRQDEYESCLLKFKSRIGLSGPENLVVLSNVSMNPLPMAGQFLTVITDAFQQVAEEEIENCLVRIDSRPAIHNFLMRGTDQLYLSYLPMFNIEGRKRQLLLAGEVTSEVMAVYIQTRKENKDASFTFHSKSTSLHDLTTLDQIFINGNIVGDVHVGLPCVYGDSSTTVLRDVKFTITNVHTNRSLHRGDLKPYPNAMPFILYGNEEEMHIDHVLGSSPNIQLSANGVKVVPIQGTYVDLSKRYLLTFDKKIEWAMQPFTDHQPPSFFSPNATFEATLQEEGTTATSKVHLTLPPNHSDIFKDYEYLNEDIAADIYVMAPKGTRKSSRQIKDDIDIIVGVLVTSLGNQHITWQHNVSHTLRRKLPLAKEYSVTLGAPDPTAIQPGVHFAIVSRFNGRYPTDARARIRMDHRAWVEKFEKQSVGSLPQAHSTDEASGTCSIC